MHCGADEVCGEIWQGWHIGQDAACQAVALRLEGVVSEPMAALSVTDSTSKLFQKARVRFRGIHYETHCASMKILLVSSTV
jgi:hypothetical protein